MKARSSNIAWFALCTLAFASCNFDTTPILEGPRAGDGGDGGGKAGAAADGGSGGRGGTGGRSGTGGAAGGGQGGGGNGGSGTGGGGGAAGQSGPCTPNSFIECQGSAAIRCSEDGSERVSQDCGADGCNAGEKRCNVCMPGEKFCSNDDTLATCGSNGLVSGMQQCDQGCNQAVTPAVCNSCTPGASFCLDTDTLRSCDSQGNAESDTDCPMGCSSTGSSSASCNACVPDQVLGCADANNQLRCKADGSGSETLPCMNGCSGSGVCNVCVPNTKACMGPNMLRTCNTDGTMFPAQTCGYGCSSLTGTAACNECTPSAAECRASNLVQCRPNGTILSSTPCTYGCDAAATPDACEPPILEPSNLPTDTCTVSTTQDLSASAPIMLNTDGALCSQVVSQGATLPEICVVRRRDVTFSAGAVVTVVGARLLALVATGNMTIQGVIDASANGPSGGPGSNTTGLGMGGTARALPENGENTPANAGGGGGGFGTFGAFGGDGPGNCNNGPPCTDAGGVGILQGNASLVPLRGGSGGGRNSSGPNSQRQAAPGGGGGGLQLVSCNTLTLNTGTVLDVGGGGGQGGRPGMVGGASVTPGAGAGGGSGGGLLIEAQTIVFGPGVVLAANGGGGGGGATRTGGVMGMDFVSGGDGDDGARGMTAADGGPRGGGTSMGGGKGGAAGVNPTAGGTVGDDPSAAGGGGGAVGRIRINNTSGSLGSVILSASPTPSVGMVTLR